MREGKTVSAAFFLNGYRSGFGIGRGAIEKAGIKKQSIRKLCKDEVFMNTVLTVFLWMLKSQKTPPDVEGRPIAV